MARPVLIIAIPKNPDLDNLDVTVTSAANGEEALRELQVEYGQENREVEFLHGSFGSDRNDEAEKVIEALLAVEDATAGTNSPIHATIAAAVAKAFQMGVKWGEKNHLRAGL